MEFLVVQCAKELWLEGLETLGGRIVQRFKTQYSYVGMLTIFQRKMWCSENITGSVVLISEPICHCFYRKYPEQLWRDKYNQRNFAMQFVWKLAVVEHLTCVYMPTTSFKNLFSSRRDCCEFGKSDACYHFLFFWRNNLCVALFFPLDFEVFLAFSSSFKTFFPQHFFFFFLIFIFDGVYVVDQGGKDHGGG